MPVRLKIAIEKLPIPKEVGCTGKMREEITLLILL